MGYHSLILVQLVFFHFSVYLLYPQLRVCKPMLVYSYIFIFLCRKVFVSCEARSYRLARVVACIAPRHPSPDIKHEISLT
jgi:hypothetical protein